MYSHIFSIHSVVRWLLLICLLATIFIYARQLGKDKSGKSIGDSFRTITVTLAHIQLVLGFFLYFESPMVKYFRSNFNEGLSNLEMTFFGLYHVSMMTIAVFVLTVGSSVSKRTSVYEQKRKYVLAYFIAALIIIFLAIPWPFSPFVARPYYRAF